MTNIFRVSQAAVWLSLLLLSSTAQAFESAPYFPLRGGDLWNYKAWIKTGPRISLPFIGLPPNSRKDGTKTITLKTGPLYKNVRSVQADSKSSWDPVRELYDLNNNSEGITLYAIDRQPNGGLICEPFTQPLRYLPPLVELGQTYQASADFYCGAGGQRFLLHWDVKIKLVGFETVTVPLGKFKALKIERSVEYNYTLDPNMKQTDIDTIWLVEQIGLVKSKGRVVNSASLALINEHEDELISTTLYGVRPAAIN